MSTRSRKSDHGKVLIFVQIGAASKSPASIFETKFAQAKASISLKATERRFGIARPSPRSMPPYPAQRLTCVIVLVVSTFCCFYGLVAVCKFCEEDRGLHKPPSKGCTGDGLGDKCNCFHVGWWLVLGNAERLFIPCFIVCLIISLTTESLCLEKSFTISPSSFR